MNSPCICLEYSLMRKVVESLAIIFKARDKMERIQMNLASCLNSFLLLSMVDKQRVDRSMKRGYTVESMFVKYMLIQEELGLIWVIRKD